MEIFCFGAGVLFAGTKSMYAFYLLCAACVFRAQWRMLGWFTAAIIWSVCHQWWTLDHRMPNTAAIKQAVLEGEVVSIPSQQGDKIQFQFLTNRVNAKAVRTKVLLSCYEHCPPIQAGERWRFQARLKKPRNFDNPGGFDYVNWLLARHITWTGSIRADSAKHISQGNAWHFVLRARQSLANMQASLGLNLQYLGIFQALTLGLTDHISKSDWDLFRRTGTTHLMVISGAHIGLVAGLSYWITKYFWRRLGRACLYCPASKMASLVGFFIALIYALLAGFGIPAQRALIACFFLFAKQFCNRRFSVWQGWRYALLAVLIWEPHSVLMPGFYLSFLAVAVLLFMNQRIALKGLKKMLLMQLSCLFGLMPFTLFWFSYGSIGGFLANLIAIPWVGFIIVPISLITLCFGSSSLHTFMVVLLNTTIKYLLTYLNIIASFPWLHWTNSFPNVLLPVVLTMGMGITLWLPFKPFFPAIMILIVATLTSTHHKLSKGEARIDVLDVGQGLAVVVHTAHHVLVYDTGAKLYRGSDMAKLVLLPYLKTLGIKTIDTIVISHSDLDHRGGLATLAAEYPRHTLIVDEPKFYKRGTQCHQYPNWDWDGVHFQFFPIRAPLLGRNNHSCVLQVATQSQQVLFSGDIESPAERYLTQAYGQHIASTVLLVPHHGSKTSSSSDFLEHVNPRYAIASYGFQNRYHFPHSSVLQSYHKHHIILYNTVDCGMISLVIGTNRTQFSPSCYKDAKQALVWL